MALLSTILTVARFGPIGPIAPGDQHYKFRGPTLRAPINGDGEPLGYNILSLGSNGGTGVQAPIWLSLEIGGPFLGLLYEGSFHLGSIFSAPDCWKLTFSRAPNLGVVPRFLAALFSQPR